MLADTCHILTHPALLPPATSEPKPGQNSPCKFIFYLPICPILQSPQHRFLFVLSHPSFPQLFFYFLMPFYNPLQISPAAFAFNPYFYPDLFSFLFKDSVQYSSLFLQHLPTRQLPSSRDLCWFLLIFYSHQEQPKLAHQ